VTGENRIANAHSEIEKASDYAYAFVIDVADATKEIEAARAFVERASATVAHAVP